MKITSSEHPTVAQHKVLVFLIHNPGWSVFDYYDFIRGGSHGLSRVSVRGAAGRMRWHLVEAGWMTQDYEVTREGREVVGR